MIHRPLPSLVPLVFGATLCLSPVGCGGDDDGGDDSGSGGGSSSSSGGTTSSGSGGGTAGGGADPGVGNMVNMFPDSGAGLTVVVPADGQAEDTTTPTTVVGTGTPDSCTSQGVIDAVLAGGVITFDCGPDPLVIELDAPAKVHNLNTPKVVIDGGGLITLSGQGTHRILYQNACDGELGIDNERCDLQDYPKTTIQNLTFIDGYDNSKEGGGAIWVRGGQFKIVNCRFFSNEAAFQGPDTGGGAVRIFGVQTKPVYIVDSTFGGEGDLANVASNGGGLSGLFANFSIYNTLFDNNEANGCCGNPATTPPGGGSGGAIYMDGLNLVLSIFSSKITNNSVKAHGSGIFFVSNDHKGVLTIADSFFTNNEEGEGNWYPETDISMHDDTQRTITDTVFE